MHANVQIVRYFIRHIEYKQFSFAVVEKSQWNPLWEGVLAISIAADNHKPPGQMVLVTHDFWIPQGKIFSQTEALKWIFECCLKVELHESMELFKFDDVAIFWPDHDLVGQPNFYDIERRR